MGTVIVAVILVLIVGAVVFNMIKKKKEGKGGCSCGCGDCGMSDICHEE